MKKILNVISSARGAASNSTQLVSAITEKLTGQYPGSTVKLRDLVEHHYPHLEEAHLNAFYAPAENATRNLRKRLGILTRL